MIDPRDVAFQANPYPVYARLRVQEPICFRPKQNDWFITRYADIVALLKNSHLGHRDETLPPPNSAQWQQLNPAFRHFAQLRDESQRLSRLWINLKNPPVHTRLHKLFNRAFTTQQIDQLRPRIQAIADHLLDQATESDTLDLIHQYTSPLAARVISEILGIPEQDQPELMRWSRILAMAIDLDQELATYEGGQLALVGFTQYFRKLLDQKQRSPSENSAFVALMLDAHIKGQLDNDELLANYSLLFLTGHSTTQHAIGNGMLALLRHPEQLRRLQATPTLVETAVDECLRYDCPAQFISRTVLDDFEYGGYLFQKGQMVHLMLGAGNRDPAQFDAPDRFDIGRTPNRHLSFGRGMHYCIGARLALTVAQIGINSLVRRFPLFMLKDETQTWESSYLIHGLKSLPVIVG